MKDPDKILEESSATATTLIRKESARSSGPKRESLLLETKRRAKSTPDQSPIRKSNHTSIPVRKDIEQMRNAGGTMVRRLKFTIAKGTVRQNGPVASKLDLTDSEKRLSHQKKLLRVEKQMFD